MFSWASKICRWASKIFRSTTKLKCEEIRVLMGHSRLTHDFVNKVGCFYTNVSDVHIYNCSKLSLLSQVLGAYQLSKYIILVNVNAPNSFSGRCLFSKQKHVAMFHHQLVHSWGWLQMTNLLWSLVGCLVSQTVRLSWRRTGDCHISPISDTFTWLYHPEWMIFEMTVWW